MAGRFVRSSKYRHVFGRSTKKELCYDNLHISKNAWDSNIIKANPQYLSVNWEAGGGGAFAVIPLSERGRLPEQPPLFRGHTAVVLDTDWSPFNDSLIASGSDDGKVFLWTVPEGFTLQYEEEEGPQDVSPVLKLAGHTRKVGHVLFHPAAENILATSSGDFTIKLWDVSTGASCLALKHNDIVQSMSWSTNGSMLVTTCRDKKLRVWDPRQEKAAYEVAGHAGAKNSRAVWLTGDVGGDKIATTGFSRMSDRQLAHWDLRTLSEGPVGGFEMLDSISGVCMPFWDEGTKCLYLAGKGDGNIRYYEFENGEFIYLSEYKSADPQRGVAFLPKRGVNVRENEVMRGFKTVNDLYIEPISFVVPRRAETYQADIYPLAASGEPALSAEAWLAGGNADPPMFDLETVYNGGETTGPKVGKVVIPSSTPAAAPPPIKTATAPALQPFVSSPVEPVKAASSPVKPTSASASATISAAPVVAVESPVEIRSKSPVKSIPPPPVYKSTTTPPLTSPVAAPVDSSTITEQLAKITALLESQNKTLASQSEQIKEQSASLSQQCEKIVELTKEVDGQNTTLSNQSEQIKQQSATLNTQSEKILDLTKEVDTLREKVETAPTNVVVGTEELEEEGRRKDERIRKLELELEEARS